MLVLAMALCLSHSLMAANAEPANENGQPEVTRVAADTTAAQTLQTGIMPLEESETVVNNITEDNADNYRLSFLENISDNLVDILGALLIFGGPIVIIILCLVYRYKLRKRRLELAEKALAAGKELPEGILDPASERSAERWIQKGTLNLFGGLGLTILTYALLKPETAALGIFVMCIGAGQVLTGVIKRKYFKQETKESKSCEATEEQGTADNASANANE